MMMMKCSKSQFKEGTFIELVNHARKKNKSKYWPKYRSITSSHTINPNKG